MAGQVLSLGAGGEPYTVTPGILIDADLLAGSNALYFREYSEQGSGNAVLKFTRTADETIPSNNTLVGVDLSGTWETADEGITLYEAGRTTQLVLGGPDHPDNAFQDSTNSYFWTPENRTEHASWVSGIGSGEVYLVLWDGVGDRLYPPGFAPVVPLVLSDFDQTGLQVDALALIEAGLEVDGDNRSYYSDSNRPPVTGSLIEGDLGLSSTETLISRFQYIFQGSNVGQVRFNDDDQPQTLSWSSYFGIGGDGADLTLYLQTADRLISVPVSSNIASFGGGFIRITIPDADDRAALAAIDDGDRFILALARTAPATNIDAEVSARAGNPTVTASGESVAVISQDAAVSLRAGNPTATVTAAVDSITNRDASVLARAGSPTVRITGEAALPSIRDAAVLFRGGNPVVTIAAERQLAPNRDAAVTLRAGNPIVVVAAAVTTKQELDDERRERLGLQQRATYQTNRIDLFCKTWLNGDNDEARRNFIRWNFQWFRASPTFWLPVGRLFWVSQPE